MRDLNQEKFDFFEHGYVIFNINDNNLIDAVNKDVDTLVETKNYRTNSVIYSYNESPRIVESYKVSSNCRSLALHKTIRDRLVYFYDNEPKAFSTINFLHSTQQPLHSDYVHFGTVPHRLLVGAWIALEDINPRSGPLQIVPFSHKLPLYDFHDINADRPKTLGDIKNNYSVYERYVISTMASEGLTASTPILRKGDCILWEANLLHGSPDCIDPKLTRRSQVTHWTFSSADIHYNPAFSSIKKNRYIKRKLDFIDLGNKE